MKEIKFKAWDKKKKDFVFYPHGIQTTVMLDGSKVITIDDEDVEFLLFTGLKDKNGKEIYEGDIVKLIDVVNEESIGEVIFNEKDASFRVKTIEGKNIDFWGFYQLLSIFMLEIEVIGNIYENPELLERKWGLNTQKGINTMLKKLL